MTPQEKEQFVNLPPKFESLLQLCKKLRSPEGCPWDQELTLEKLVPIFEEEVQEIGQAVEKQDTENLAEELGDTLFNLAMFITIAEERDDFQANQVFRHIKEKCIRRHSWVFDEDQANTPTEARKLWLRNKKDERKNANTNH